MILYIYIYIYNHCAAHLKMTSLAETHCTEGTRKLFFIQLLLPIRIEEIEHLAYHFQLPTTHQNWLACWHRLGKALHVSASPPPISPPFSLTCLPHSSTPPSSIFKAFHPSQHQEPIIRSLLFCSVSMLFTPFPRP